MALTVVCLDMEAQEATWSAVPFVPATNDLSALRTAVNRCHGCPIYLHATQGVFGAGPAHAKLMLIGEQPGDLEDQAGAPFVGPAGRILAEALVEAGIDGKEVYVTNAVKHFKWVPEGARRLHAKPNRREIRACRPWLSREIETVGPERIGCLGATAAESLFGRPVKIGEARGQAIRGSEAAKIVVVTAHPAAILRSPSEDRAAAFQELVKDLKLLDKADA